MKYEHHLTTDGQLEDEQRSRCKHQELAASFDTLQVTRWQRTVWLKRCKIRNLAWRNAKHTHSTTHTVHNTHTHTHHEEMDQLSQLKVNKTATSIDMTECNNIYMTIYSQGRSLTLYYTLCEIRELKCLKRKARTKHLLRLLISSLISHLDISYGLD